MPTYEYKCKECGSTFTLIQPIWAERKGNKCPHCGSENTERLISRFSSTTGGSESPGGSCGPFS